MQTYDVLVIGAGHAGCEAARAAARMGCRTLLLTISLDMIGHMPCSPSIGGLGKGHLVKEIDALGGIMARIADQSAIQFRTLNTSKGPAVRGTRTQNDKQHYRTLMKQALEQQDSLDIVQALIASLVIEDGRAAGAVDIHGTVYTARTVVLTTGTFLGGLVHIGDIAVPAGRAGEFAATDLADQLRGIGFPMGRMKTGTPARIHRRSIDFSAFAEQPGENDPSPFARTTESIPLPQVPCHIGHTNAETHAIIRDNISHSPLYSGRITGISARYCPSLEDKVMRFAEKDRHQIILEPEGLATDEIYVSGLGNSMPPDIQAAIAHSIPGLDHAEIMRPAYAIEYDFIQPTALHSTLEAKAIPGLYFAGQVNGTSGYEEAAAQGLWAGINAACSVQGRPPFILDRTDGYLGVMIDDLVTHGTREPYRMFTSRAEYRLLFREDNAYDRLVGYAYELGLQPDTVNDSVADCRRMVEAELERLKTARVKASPEVNALLTAHGSSPVNESSTLDQLLKRPELTYDDVIAASGDNPGLPADVRNQVEIQSKYEGYLKRQEAEVRKFKHIEQMKIPTTFEYCGIPSLSNELIQKLSEIRPVSVGQASRIPGMTPAALSVLMIKVKQHQQQSA